MMMRNYKKMSPPETRQRIIRTVYFFLALLTLVACNGSGGGDLLAGGGIGGTGISVGVISGFGSVIVNDVDFDTEKAEVMVNGNSVGAGDSIVRSALALGMVVRVEGKYRTDGAGIAERIVFHNNLNGPITSIESFDSIAKKVMVLGQVVIVDERTRFKNTNFDSIAVGNMLQVSGWPDVSGVIRATFVAKTADSQDPAGEVMIRGTVTETNRPQRRFRINELIVDLSEITDAVPEVGQLVAIRGVLDDNDILVATALSVEDELGLDDADSVDIEGIVSQVSSPADFILGSTAVQTDEATLFIGLVPDDIVPGARLRVNGALINRRLLADEVIAQDRVSIEGQIAEVNGTQFTLKGLDGLVISVSGLTKIFGDASDVNGLSAGYNVKVLGYAATENQVEATQVKVKDDVNDKMKLQGPVTAINRSTVTIFQVRIETLSIPDDGFETDTEGAVSRNEFLDLVAVGDTVSVTGNLVGGMAKWKATELSKE
jgi:hypothetical protein